MVGPAGHGDPHPVATHVDKVCIHAGSLLFQRQSYSATLHSSHQVLARVYMARSDVGYTVRTAAVHVWKTVVSNTPRTLGEILPALMEQVIDALASAGERPGLVGSQLTPLLA